MSDEYPAADHARPLHRGPSAPRQAHAIGKIARIHLAEVETDVCYDSEKREMAEAVIAMEAELERRRYITVGVRDLLFKSTDRNVWLLAATLNYACDDVEELPEDCLATAALDPKQGAADGE